MEFYLQLFVLIPLSGFFVSLFIPKKNENLISWVALTTVGIHFLLTIGIIFVWFFHNHNSIDFKELSIYKANDYDFFIDLHFDKISATFLFVGSFLTFLIVMYCRRYMHREKGFKRFFSILLFFYLGFNFILVSGNFETLFIGWEILGVSSFLLIAFYRDRYLPVKNAVKVFSIYRIGDIGIVLAMWLSHHMFHENITFQKVFSDGLTHKLILNHSYEGVIIAILILISASAKSALLPFSSWLPRAMEGPTPSSAIFYGSLSIHIGAFLMLRTYPFWENQTSFRIFVILLGAITSIVAILTSRVQSSVKSQIAYSSIGQIGLIFIEIALGFDELALVHIAGNAFLRTYQLLVSPSNVSYKIREQFYNFKPRVKTIEDSWPKKIEYSLYVLSLKEWNLDSFMYKYLWNPSKKLGGQFNFLTFKNVFLIFIPFLILGISFNYHQEYISKNILYKLPTFFAFLGIISTFKAFTERNSVRLSWSLIILNHFFIALAISYNEHCESIHLIWYLSGVIICGTAGYFCIQRLRKFENWVSLDQFHGHSSEHPKIALVFLIACLGLAGFPITPSFIGEDLIFSHIHENQILLAFFVAASFVLNGIAAIRIYARIFLGPNSKNHNGKAQRTL